MRPAAISLALLVGCVDVTRPVARGTVSAVSRERAAAETTERQRRALLPRLADDQRSDARIVGREGAIQHAVVGPLRYDLAGGVATAAEDVTAHPIAFARRATRGWVFVTDHDEVYVSPSFTGALRALRSFGCDAPPPAPAPGAAQAEPPDVRPVIWGSRGRVAFSLRGRALWSDGASLRAVEVPELAALAWRDDAHGAMIVGYRTLRATSDGGATWRDVALGDAAPLDLSGEDGTLTVTTSTGRRVLRDDGSLADAPEAAPPAEPRCRRLEAVGPATVALFGRGYTRVAAARAECVSPPAEARWEMNRIVAHLPRDGGEDEMPMWSVPRGRPAPLGTTRSRAFMNTHGVPAVVSATRPDAPSPGHPITLAWRGEDERGPFAVRVATTAPREIPVSAAWRLVAATRAGLLVEVGALADGAVPNDDTDAAGLTPDLFWLAAAGVRRLHVALHGERHPVGVALGDGGAVLLSRDQPTSGEDYCEHRRTVATPGVSFALRLDASGAVIARRDVVTGETSQPLVGLGQTGDRWGVVVGEGASLTLLLLDGGSVPFGAWQPGDAPAVCRAAATERLHLLGGLSGDEYEIGPPVTIGPQGDGPNFAEARLVTLERSGERVCVRRIWGVQRLDNLSDEGEDLGDLYGAARFTARGGRLVGPFDDGRRIATVSASLSDRVGFIQDI